MTNKLVFAVIILCAALIVCFWVALAKLVITEGPYVVGTLIADTQKAYDAEKAK